MVSFDEVKRFENQYVVITTRNRSVYTGKISNVRKPEKEAIGDNKFNVTIADVEFDPCLYWCEASEKLLLREQMKKHPIWNTDEFFNFDLGTLVEKLRKLGYVDHSVVLPAGKDFDFGITKMLEELKKVGYLNLLYREHY